MSHSTIVQMIEDNLQKQRPSKDDAFVEKVMNLNDRVVEMDKVLQRTIGEDVDLRTVLTPNPWSIKADPTQAEQVIINLVVNACEAMLDGGRLTIETVNVTLDDRDEPPHFGEQPGEYVLLTVSDTGHGMSDEVLPHIFEPSFTTKERRPGLGLATVYDFVKRNKGYIWVYSEEGNGMALQITCREVTLEKHVNRDHDALGILSAIPETVASFWLPPVKTRVPTIPAGLKDLLPRAQVEPTLRDRYDRLAAHPLRTLCVSGLSRQYTDSGRGIEDIHLCLERRSFTMVTGRIGSGKTTLLRTLLGLLPADAGEVRWNGEPVADAASFFVPPRCAYTVQAPRLFSESLRDNVLMGLPEERADLDGAIRLAVMDRDLAEMGDGLDTQLGAKGVRLSGGQVQRTAAARMYVRDPELLVFDDLSSALDVETERTLWARLFERGTGDDAPTCLVVSPRRPALRRADHSELRVGSKSRTTKPLRP